MVAVQHGQNYGDEDKVPGLLGTREPCARRGPEWEKASRIGWQPSCVSKDEELIKGKSWEAAGTASAKAWCGGGRRLGSSVGGGDQEGVHQAGSPPPPPALAPAPRGRAWVPAASGRLHSSPGPTHSLQGES